MHTWNSSPSSDTYKLFLQLTCPRGADEVYNMEQMYGHTQSHQTKGQKENKMLKQCYKLQFDESGRLLIAQVSSAPVHLQNCDAPQML